MNKTKTIINTESSLNLLVKQVYKNSTPFSMTKRFNMLFTKDKSEMDLIDIVGNLSKGSTEFFLLLKDKTNYKTNMASIDIKLSTQNIRNKRYKALKELSTVNLVKACKVYRYSLEDGDTGVKQPSGVYIINPKYIIPPQDYIDIVSNNWEKS